MLQYICNMSCYTQNAKHYIFTAALIVHPFKFWSAAYNSGANGLNEAFTQVY
jgi:hypothetical protein